MQRKFANYALALLLQLLFSTATVFAQDAALPSAVKTVAKSTANNLPDATVIQGVNTAGVVRVNSLGCLESLVNILVNGFEVLGITIGAVFLIRLLTRPLPESLLGRMWTFSKVIVPICFGLSFPKIASWLGSVARDTNLFF